MITFYYTASENGARQLKSHLSIGGYKSSSIVPNDVFGNMFSDISMYTVRMGLTKNYIAFIIHNDSSSSVTPDIWVEKEENCYSNIKVSPVDLATDPDGALFMERVIHNAAKPVYAEFVSIDTEANKISLGTIPAGGFIGLWVERELDLDKIKEDQNKIYEKDPNDPYRFVQIELEKQDSIEFHVEY